MKKCHPGARSSLGHVASGEVTVRRLCPDNLHFYCKKSLDIGIFLHDHHSHSSATTYARSVVVKPSKEDSNSCLEGAMAGDALGRTLATKGIGSGRFLLVLLVLLVVPLSAAKLMKAEPSS